MTHRAASGLAIALLIQLAVQPVAAATPVLADSAWPMYQHDQRHSGQALTSGPRQVRIKWTFAVPVGDDIDASVAIARDKTIYLPLGGGQHTALYALKPDGHKKWTFVPDGSIAATPAVASDGTIYFGVSSGDPSNRPFYALKADGKVKWQTIVSGLAMAPAIASDGTVIVAVVGGGVGVSGLRAFSPTGAPVWSRDLEVSGYTAPALGTDGTVYVGTTTGLDAVNPDGTLLWSLPLGADLAPPAVALDGTIFVGSQSQNLYAVSPAGQLMWSRPVSGQVGVSPALSSVSVVVAASNALQVFDYAGNELWGFQPAGDGFRLSPPIVDSQGVVYAGTDGGTVYALQAGSVLWSYYVGSVQSGAVLAADGTLFVGTKNTVDGAHLWAFKR